LQLWKLRFSPHLIEQAKAMKSYENKTGLTLIEMLIVVAIIVILTTLVIGIAARINNQSKEQLAESTIAIVTAALREFRDYEYRYRDNPNYTPAERQFYLGLDFPVDCNGFDVLGLRATLDSTLGLAPGSVVIGPVLAHNDPNFSGGEVLYFFLNKVPECRKTLDKIHKSDKKGNIVRSLITNEGANKQSMNIMITHPSGTTEVYPLLRIIDPWGTTLRYDYYNRLEPDPFLRSKGKRTFPVITSAGPDKNFGTADDISSR